MRNAKPNARIVSLYRTSFSHLEQSYRVVAKMFHLEAGRTPSESSAEVSAVKAYYLFGSRHGRTCF